MSEKYTNAHTPLQFKCSNDHIFDMNFNKIQQGTGCRICGYERNKESLRHPYEHVKRVVESKGFYLSSDEYTSNKHKLDVICPKGHRYKVNFNNFSTGTGCPKCNELSTSSKPEKELLLYVSSVYDGDIVANDRTQIINHTTGKNLELDIWIPDIKKAIEFNGIYWHSLPKAMIHDDIKMTQCLENGIDLLVIDEYSWDVDIDNCKTKINKHLGIL